MHKAIEIILCVVIVISIAIGCLALFGFLMADFTMVPVMLIASIVAFLVNKILIVMVEKSV